MLGLPTFLLAAIIGYYVDGVHGLTVGAACGWVFTLLLQWFASAIMTRQTQIIQDVSMVLHKIQISLSEVSALNARSIAIQTALLDAAPVSAYDIMEMGTPRTAKEWELIEPDRWKMLRRRLVVAHGLSPHHVDAAERYIIDQHVTKNPLPKSDEALAEMVKAWKRSEKWAWDQVGPRNAHADHPQDTTES